METIHSHQFFTYLDSVWKKKIHQQFKDEWYYSASDDDYEENDIVLQILEKQRARYLPTRGEPLKFFHWFFHEGVNHFIESCQSRPTAYPKSKRIKPLSESKTELDELFNYEVLLVRNNINILLQNSIDFKVLQSYLIEIRNQINDFRPNKVDEDLYYILFKPALDDALQKLSEIVDGFLVKCGYSKDELDSGVLRSQEKTEILTNIFNIDLLDNRFIEYSAQADFIQFFMKPQERKTSTKFNVECKSNEAAIILSRMKALGFTISYDELDKNKTFKLSNDSHLTASYISKAISLSKKNNTPKTLNKINTFFHELENKYFYKKGKN